MKKYKICFIGLGSIAKRHIKNVSSYLKSNSADVEISVFRSGKGDPAEEKNALAYIDRIIYDINDTDDDYDVIFITNPTSSHAETLCQFRNKAKSFFIEKPVFHRSNIDISRLALPQDKIYYVACPLRYTKVIQYLKRNMDFNYVINLQAVSSSYLPEWRKGIDYRNSYSAHKELGGGVALDLIHEWDYITYLAGIPKKTFSIIKKVSDLEINSDDVAVYLGEYDDKIVEIHLDYFTRKPIRQLTIRTNTDMINANLLTGEIEFSQSRETLLLSEERNDMYIKEIEHFFNIIENKVENTNDINRALQTLKIAEGN